MQVPPRFVGLAAAIVVASGLGGAASAAERTAPLPQIRSAHGAAQLYVDGRPFLALAGELENSTASDRAYLGKYWAKLQAMNLNTVIAPVAWETIEPKEGAFDFRSVDALLADARTHDMRLVLLWFGSWKNSMSSYVPAWVKRDQVRFPRARDAAGRAQEILSPYADANLQADGKAFRALMLHLKSVDSARRTVIAVQVENEVGMLPDARDHSPAAEAAFSAPVPPALIAYLRRHDGPERAAWIAGGSRSDAAWADTFGAGLATDEMFNAWGQAWYTGQVAAAGKAVYPLPLYANAALIRPGRKPGEYPSGGPLPHLFAVWKAAAPALDFLAPDLYFPNFVEWADRYARPDNPLFVPETGRTNGAEMGANAFYAFGSLSAMGFAPYAVEYLNDKDAAAIADAYAALRQLSPTILAAQGTGSMVGIRAPADFEGTVDLGARNYAVGPYAFKVLFAEPPPTSVGAKPAEAKPGAHGGLIVRTDDDTFLVGGTGLTVYFGTADGSGDTVGLDAVEEGRFVGSRWVAGRRLNGDLTNQARFVRLPIDSFTILRVRLYRYR